MMTTAAMKAAAMKAAATTPRSDNRVAATSTRPRPVPPAPMPPAAPPMPRWSLTDPARHPMPAVRPAPVGRARGAGVARRPAGPLAARVIATAAVTMAVVGGLGWLGHAGDPGIPERTAVVRVGAGETVWDVAARVAPGSDQRAVVERIRRLNSLSGAAVQPDQRLLVPDGR